MKTYSRKNSSYLKKAFIASNFNEMCRLCLSELDLGLTPIFQESAKFSYQEWIQYSVDVLIEEDDGLPSNICEECLAMVEQTYLFKKKCRASDSKLREHLELLEQNQEGKLSEIINLTEDHNTLFTREKPSKSKCDESSKVDTGGTLEQVEPVKKKTDPEKRLEEMQQTNTKTTDIQAGKEIAHPEAQEKVVINKVKRYILKGEKRADGQEEDLTVCEVVPLDVRNEELSSKSCTLTYTTLKCSNQNGDDGSQEEKVQELYQLWENEDIGEGGQNHRQSKDGIMLLDVSWEDNTDKNKRKQNLGLLEVNVEQNGVVQLHRVYTNKNQHKKTPKEYKCFVCSETFKTGLQVKAHLAKFHQDVAESAFCDVCGKTFVCLNNLKRHMGIHMGYKPHKCKICGRRFSQGSILKRHIFTHETLKPFVCQICGKSYTQKTNLLSHLKNHGFKTETESFTCQYCNKSFVHQSGLSRHLKLHKGVRFHCKYCKKSFGDSSALSRHVKVIHYCKT